ncbi:helicase-related protein [Kiloniella sp.]|uniref:helicase-related protein n=1 Tax=Kiloniella sp. TaxID=1938587 RepID=UPI003B0113CB
MQKINHLPPKHGVWDLRDYQVEDLAFYIPNERVANLSDPGTGKTPSVCKLFQFVWEYLNGRSIWSMPKSLLGKNRDEILQFTDFQPEEVAILDGTPKQREKILTNKDIKVFLMGFKRFGDDWERILQFHPDIKLHAVDEIHLGFGGHNSQRTQSLYRSSRKIERFLPMTGTLINGRLDSAYPTLHIIEPRYYFSWQAFQNYHAYFDEWGAIIGWKNHDRLGRIIERHSIRRTFEEIFGEQEVVYEHRTCEMSPRQRKAYIEFEKEGLLELEEDFLDGSSAGVHAIRCRQIMANPEKFDLTKGEPTGKDEQLLIDIADHKNTGEPLLIFGVFDLELRRTVDLCRKMGLRTELINGTISAKKRAEIDVKFRQGKLDCVAASAETASVGYNWAHIDHTIFLSIDYKDSNFVQAVRRAIRGKRKRPLRVSIYQYARSMDQRIFQVVDAKSDSQNKVDGSYKKLNLSKTNAEVNVETPIGADMFI